MSNAKTSMVAIEGFEELESTLKAMGKAAESATDPATEAGANVIQREANSRARKSNAIGTRLLFANAARALYAIGLLKEFWYLKFFETGTQPHEIEGDPLMFQGDSGLIVTKKVQHTGMTASPFMAPAWKKNVKEISDTMGSVFLKAIMKFVR